MTAVFTQTCIPTLMGIETVIHCAHGPKNKVHDLYMCTNCIKYVIMNKNGKTKTDNPFPKCFERLKSTYPKLAGIITLILFVSHNQEGLQVADVTVNGMCIPVPVAGFIGPHQSFFISSPNIKLRDGSVLTKLIQNTIRETAISYIDSKYAQYPAYRAVDIYNEIVAPIRMLPNWHPLFFGMIHNTTTTGFINDYVNVLRNELNVTCDDVNAFMSSDFPHGEFGAPRSYLEKICEQLYYVQPDPVHHAYANIQTQALQHGTITSNFNANFNKLLTPKQLDTESVMSNLTVIASSIDEHIRSGLDDSTEYDDVDEFNKEDTNFDYIDMLFDALEADMGNMDFFDDFDEGDDYTLKIENKIDIKEASKDDDDDPLTSITIDTNANMATVEAVDSDDEERT